MTEQQIQRHLDNGLISEAEADVLRRLHVTGEITREKADRLFAEVFTVPTSA